MRRIFGRGRYATVASTLALVIALSGTAYAVNTVRSTDIVNGTIRTVDVAPSGLGRSPRLFGQVGAGAQLLGHSGVTSVTNPAPGEYTVTFNRSVGNCAISITPFLFVAEVGYDGSGASVNVHIRNLAGNPASIGFDIIAVC